MGFTLAEKIIMKNTGKSSVKPGDIVIAKPDMVMIHDIYTPFVEKQFIEMGFTKVWNPDKVVLIHDHLIPTACTDDVRHLKAGEEFVEKYNIKKFHPNDGICHELMPAKGYALPGSIVFVTDSHTTTYGAVGSFSTGIGFTEMASILGDGEMWIKVPESIKICIEGELSPGVFAKDIILRIMGDLGADGGTYKSLEFTGSTIKSLSIASRLTMANMTVEAGAKVGLFEPDEKTAEYSKVDLESLSWMKADEDAVYDRVLHYKAEEFVPSISCPPFVDNVKPITEVVGTKLNQIFLGSCTNGRLEDLEIAASILKDKKIAKYLKFIVTPASKEIFQEACRKGIIETLVKAGAMITHPGCTLCCGRSIGIVSEGEVVLGTNNRNFLGRMGSNEALIYLSSPAVAAASAITGEITDPRGIYF